MTKAERAELIQHHLERLGRMLAPGRAELIRAANYPPPADLPGLAAAADPLPEDMEAVELFLGRAATEGERATFVAAFRHQLARYVRPRMFGADHE